MSPSRGFSLMEVLIAVAITTMIGGLVLGSFNTTFATKDAIESEADLYREIRGGMNRLAREISMAFISNNYDTRRFRDAADRPTFFTGERDELSFTMFGHQRLAQDAKESDQSAVYYKIGRDPDVPEQTALLRCEKAVFDEDMDRCETWETLVSNAKKIEFKYWNNKDDDWTNEWNTRRSDFPNTLPDRVLITLTLVDLDKQEKVFTTQARLNLLTALESR